MHHQNAEEALALLSSGDQLGHSLAISGALELQPIAERPGASVDFMDAYWGLHFIATGGELNLGASGRRRAARLADVVRSLGVE